MVEAKWLGHATTHYEPTPCTGSTASIQIRTPLVPIVGFTFSARPHSIRSCPAPEPILNRFGTPQGIVMGLLADVILAAILAAGADYLTAKENYRTIGEHEDRKIAKRWGFEYVGMYFWFLFLAFIYVPYGADVQAQLCNEDYMVLGPLSRFLCWTSIPLDMFKIDRIQIDEFFVTPLVATQLINLLLETALPGLLQQVRQRASSAIHKRTGVATRMAERLAVAGTELPTWP